MSDQKSLPTFEGGKSAEVLGIDTSKTFVVVKEGLCKLAVGSRVVLERDDGSTWPPFKREGEVDPEHEVYYLHWENLTYADNSFLDKVQNTMAQLTNIAKQILDPELKALVKAGYLDTSLALTTEGSTAMREMLFLENKTKLAKLAEEKITEDEKAAKKA